MDRRLSSNVVVLYFYIIGKSWGGKDGVDFQVFNVYFTPTRVAHLRSRSLR